MREKIEKNETFLANLTENQMELVVRNLQLDNYPMALISPELTVLHQTESSRYLLDENDFYSLEAYLEPDICEELHRCIQEKASVQTTVELLDQRWTLRAEPTEEGALLFFFPMRERQIGVTASLAALRSVANHLLFEADKLEEENPEAARKMRYDGMRTMRQSNRLELLWGAPRAASYRSVTPGAIVQRVSKRLALLGVGIWTGIDQRSATEEIVVDEPLLQSALGALICNSLQYGGPDVHITLRVARNERGVVFTVGDDGPGLSPEARARMDNTWLQQTARPGSWGLGVPYVREIAAIHGGSLMYTGGADGSGCCARMFLPCSENDEVVRLYLYGKMKIVDSSISPIDVEMSGVLKESAYVQLEPEPFHQEW